MPEGGMRLAAWNGSDATRQLEETITRIQRQNASQQKTMLWLTGVSALCAFAAAILSLFQLLHSH
jgi:hypothetical protein